MLEIFNDDGETFLIDCRFVAAMVDMHNQNGGRVFKVITTAGTEIVIARLNNTSNPTILERYSSSCRRAMEAYAEQRKADGHA